MTLNQANQVNAKANTFTYWQAPVGVSAMNDSEFALAA
jgi:hypothetical protein